MQKAWAFNFCAAVDMMEVRPRFSDIAEVVWVWVKDDCKLSGVKRSEHRIYGFVLIFKRGNENLKSWQSDEEIKSHDCNFIV